MEQIYLTLDSSAINKHVNYPFLLISAACLKTKRGFRKLRTHENVKEIFLDSGGYSFIYDWGKYPFSIERYALLSKQIRASYTAIMDYPCLPPLSSFENIERVEKTIENAKKCLKLKGIKWVTVIQGYTLDQYKYCIEQIEENYLETELVGVGSLATRNRIEEIYNILNLVRKHFDKIHGFGVSLRHLKDIRIFNALHSCDTGAWRWNQNQPKQQKRKDRKI